MSSDEVIELVLEETREKMVKALQHSEESFAEIRTGRASPQVVSKIRVEYFGSDVPLQQLAGFSVPEPRLLVISPYDKGSMQAIEKAIERSDLGMTPSNDGSVIRLNFPPLTEERRKELVKVVKHRAEEGRVAVRNLRRSARNHLEAMEKNAEISSDGLERAEKELEKLTHEFVEAVDKALSNKERELLEV
jgi:ribosome recycling factor